MGQLIIIFQPLMFGSLTNHIGATSTIMSRSSSFFPGLSGIVKFPCLEKETHKKPGTLHLQHKAKFNLPHTQSDSLSCRCVSESVCWWSDVLLISLLKSSLAPLTSSALQVFIFSVSLEVAAKVLFQQHQLL